jgi:hypothetical protein
MGSYNGQVPLIIQEGRARAGQSTSRAGRGKIPLSTVSSHAEGVGETELSMVSHANVARKYFRTRK